MLCGIKREETGRTTRPVAAAWRALLDSLELVVGVRVGRAVGVAASWQRLLGGLFGCSIGSLARLGQLSGLGCCLRFSACCCAKGVAVGVAALAAIAVKPAPTYSASLNW